MNGCIDDSDNDGIGDNLDLCETFVLDDDYPVDEFGCRPIDSPLTITDPDVIGLVEGYWSNSLEVQWRIYDDDLDPYLTGARVMINQTGNHSFFPIINCVGEEVIAENGFHKCVWYISSDLPIFDITGYRLHVQFFAQSLNGSPEANNDMVYLDSSVYFSTLNEDYFLSERGDVAPGSSNATRALGWGLIHTFIAIIPTVVTNDDGKTGRSKAVFPGPFVGAENDDWFGCLVYLLCPVILTR